MGDLIAHHEPILRMCRNGSRRLLTWKYACRATEIRRFRTSLYKRLAAVERVGGGEVSVQFPHRASRFGDRMPLLELCGAMAVIRCVSCELQYF
jgi:hypothetical protein